LLLTQILLCIWRVSWVKASFSFFASIRIFLRFNRLAAASPSRGGQDPCWPHGLEGYVPVRVNRLEEILQTKRGEIKRLRSRAAELDRQALARTDLRDFRAALQLADEKLAVIAEIKKASPSAGLIAKSFEPVEVAKNYEHAGANAISVLTDTQFFQGKLQHLADVRRPVSLPLLRKDFILDETQIAESAANGADAILLIVAALEQKQLIELLRVTATYQLDALVEVHTRDELNRALDAGAKIIGINNRNLATFDVDLAVTEELCREVPDEIVLVSESGIKTPQDVTRVKACGVDAILVGEALMRGEISIEELRGM
jgi:indole-3-glycerol phosphate synthase